MDSNTKNVFDYARSFVGETKRNQEYLKNQIEKYEEIRKELLNRKPEDYWIIQESNQEKLTELNKIHKAILREIKLMIKGMKDNR